ncbi:hypothetical protein Pmani_022347 [Petrolisthes manimaculis]|uniref:Uncharacterized protein n=1 Tax=Petrolisthes manimaculis TaxID=1843537 RepID=A0AAE1U0R1_9EUCA|nr:hypothetical protein Pmani_022347 [Petrolisthes manimaculis]
MVLFCLLTLVLGVTTTTLEGTLQQRQVQHDNINKQQQQQERQEELVGWERKEEEEKEEEKKQDKESEVEIIYEEKVKQERDKKNRDHEHKEKEKKEEETKNEEEEEIQEDKKRKEEEEKEKEEGEEEETVVPDPTTHLYYEEVDGDEVVREYLLLEVHPRTALLCPKGFAISKIKMVLRAGKEFRERDPTLAIPFSHWLVRRGINKGDHDDDDDDEREKEDSQRVQTKCDTLSRCLGYQACLFNFGIEFCHQDPLPGQRKNLHVMLTCLRDARLLAEMEAVQYDPEYVLKIDRRANYVLHLTYISRLEEGVTDYSLTEVEGRETEEGGGVQCKV